MKIVNLFFIAVLMLITACNPNNNVSRTYISDFGECDCYTGNPVGFTYVKNHHYGTWNGLENPAAFPAYGFESYTGSTSSQNSTMVTNYDDYIHTFRVACGGPACRVDSFTVYGMNERDIARMWKDLLVNGDAHPFSTNDLEDLDNPVFIETGISITSQSITGNILDVETIDASGRRYSLSFDFSLPNVTTSTLEATARGSLRDYFCYHYTWDYVLTIPGTASYIDANGNTFGCPNAIALEINSQIDDTQFNTEVANKTVLSAKEFKTRILGEVELTILDIDGTNLCPNVPQFNTFLKRSVLVD